MAKTDKGDRIVQIILLLLLAGGIAGALLLQSGKSGAPSGAHGAAPGSGQSGSRPSFPPGGAPGMNPSGKKGSSAIAVEVITLERSTVSQSIKVNGDVTAETSVEIYPDTGGRLVSRKIHLGDSVRKGQVIAAVDPSVPGQNYSTSPVNSTISGTVIELPYQVGATITTQTSVATIGDLNDLVILTFIPERYIASLKDGLKAELSFDAYPEEPFEAEIYEISPVMDAETRTLAVKLRMSTEDKRIRPGMFATMELITKQSIDTLAVPSVAVFNYYGDSAVYVISSEGKAERRIVSTGLKSDTAIEITDGLTEGEKVITQGLSNITEGSVVKAVSLEEAS